MRSLPTPPAALPLGLPAPVLPGAGGGGDDDAGTNAPLTASSRTTTAPSSTTTTAPAVKPVEGDAVSIKDFAFGPMALQVAVGTTVTWSNDDETAHTATADDGTFDTKSLQPGSSGTFTFDRAGTFSYHCDIHPTMKAEILVR